MIQRYSLMEPIRFFDQNLTARIYPPSAQTRTRLWYSDNIKGIDINDDDADTLKADRELQGRKQLQRACTRSISLSAPAWAS